MKPEFLETVYPNWALVVPLAPNFQLEQVTSYDINSNRNQTKKNLTVDCFPKQPNQNPTKKKKRVSN